MRPGERPRSGSVPSGNSAVSACHAAPSNATEKWGTRRKRPDAATAVPIHLTADALRAILTDMRIAGGFDCES